MQSFNFGEPNTILVLGCLGIVQALFLTIYLLTLKTGNRQANVLLGLLLLGLTIRIGKAVIYNYTYIGPWPRNLGISGFLLAGPFLWFYGRTLFEKDKTFPKKNYYHLIPFVLFVLFSKIIPNDRDALSLIPYTLVQLHFLFYIGCAWWLIYGGAGNAQHRLAPWYRNITIGVTLVYMLYAGIFIGIIPFYLLGATSFSFLIYIFSFLFLKKHHFVLEKYAKSSVGTAESKQLVQKVRDLFEKEETYLSSEASLQVIAAELDVKPRILSQAINENEQMNFSEFVNHYRIERAKELLIAPARKQDKIATIAFDCGFGNVTSFNIEFKSRVKLTPSQFRKQFATA
ncbi:MAG: helix-turn-helix domain-containing protein [Rhodothermales bacterium]